MPERYITACGDEFENDNKQKELEVIKKNIQDIFDFGESTDFETVESPSLTTTEVCDYLQILKEEGIARFKTINSIPVEEEEIEELCNHLSINSYQLPQQGEIQIHFLEKEDFAATLIVIQTGIRGVTTKIEPLEESPRYLVEKWRKIIDQESNVQKAESKKKRFSHLKSMYGI